MVSCPACGQPLSIRSADVLETKVVLRARCLGCRRVWLAEVPQSAFYSPDEPAGGDTSPPSAVRKYPAYESDADGEETYERLRDSI